MKLDFLLLRRLEMLEKFVKQLSGLDLKHLKIFFSCEKSVQCFEFLIKLYPLLHPRKTYLCSSLILLINVMIDSSNCRLVLPTSGLEILFRDFFQFPRHSFEFNYKAMTLVIS